MALAGFDDVAEIPSAFPDLDALLALAQTPDQMRRAPLPATHYAP